MTTVIGVFFFGFIFVSADTGIFFRSQDRINGVHGERFVFMSIKKNTKVITMSGMKCLRMTKQPTHFNNEVGGFFIKKQKN